MVKCKKWQILETGLTVDIFYTIGLPELQQIMNMLQYTIGSAWSLKNLIPAKLWSGVCLNVSCFLVFMNYSQ